MICILLLTAFVASVCGQTSPSVVDYSQPFFDPLPGGKTTNPGARLRLTKIGFDKATTILNPALFTGESTIADIRLPIANGELTIKNIRAMAIAMPFKYDLLQNVDQIRGAVKNGHANYTGQWSTTVRPPLRQSPLTANGKFTACGCDITMVVTATPVRSASPSNKPSVNTATLSCSVRVNTLNVTYAGDQLNLTKATQDMIAVRVRSDIERELCKMLKKFVESSLNPYLSTFPTKLQLLDTQLLSLLTTTTTKRPSAVDDKLYLDYELTQNPDIVTESNYTYIDGLLKGSVLSRGVSSYWFAPFDLASKQCSHDMEFAMSDYLLNTLLFATHQRRMIKFSVNEKQLALTTGRLLRLSCSVAELCLSSVFDINNKFPAGSYAEFNMETVESPRATFGQNVANWTTKAHMQINVRPPRNAPVVTLFKSKLPKVFAVLNPKLFQNTITASTDIQYIEFKVEESPFGLMNGSKLQKLANITSSVMQELVNGVLSVGLPVPLTAKIRMINSKLSLLPRTLTIHSDFQYKP